jgi:hypothetical protein
LTTEFHIDQEGRRSSMTGAPAGRLAPARRQATVSDPVGPGFISITVSDTQRSAMFYEQQLGARRDPYDFGPGAVAS